MNTVFPVSGASPDCQDVCLVNMPLSGIERPSISLGLLQSILQDAGISTGVAYPNLWFAEYFGIDLVITLQSTLPQDAVVDWMFSSAAFPEFQPDHEAYLKLLEQNAPQLARGGLTSTQLKKLRDQMPGFVDWSAKKILSRSPRIVGCTSTFQQHVASIALLKRLKELNPDLITMLGGANCESVMGRTTHRNFSWIDIVVSGEADEFVAPLVDSLLEEGCNQAAEDLPFGVFAPIHRVEGYPETDQGDGVPRAITEDTRGLPLPNYDDYFSELQRCLYAAIIEPGMPMEFSRGCWWGAKSHCTFCGLNGGSMAYRASDPDDVVKGMAVLSEKYGVDKIEAVDNIMDTRYFKTVLPELSARNKPFKLFFETKSNMKAPQIKALADAGVIWIQPGIESLDSRVLTLMGKGCTAAQNILLLKWCRQYGIRVSWSVIYNFPGEHDSWYEEMAAIAPMLSHLQPGNMADLRYDRYSPYFTRPEKYDLNLKPADGYQYAYPLTGDDLFDQVYFFKNDPPLDTGNRPGLASMHKIMNEWTRIWRTSEPPVVTKTEASSGWEIEDSRPGKDTTHLDGLHCEVLSLADDGPPEHFVSSKLEQLGHTPSRIETVLKDLEKRELLLRLDGRVISLVLEKPHTRIPLPLAFPGGSIHVKRKTENILETLLS